MLFLANIDQTCMSELINLVNNDGADTKQILNESVKFRLKLNFMLVSCFCTVKIHNTCLHVY